MTADRPSTLRFYLTIIRRRWLPMLIAFVIPVAIALVIALNATKQYSGTALVVINRQSLADELTGATNPSASSSDFLNIINTYADAAHSTQVANRVAAAVPSAHLTGAELLKKSTVTARQDADIVQFTVTNPNPAVALTAGARVRQRVRSLREGARGLVDRRGAASGRRPARDRPERARHDAGEQPQRPRSTAADAGDAADGQQLRGLADDHATVTSPRRTLDIVLGVIAASCSRRSSRRPAGGARHSGPLQRRPAGDPGDADAGASGATAAGVSQPGRVAA